MCIVCLSVITRPLGAWMDIGSCCKLISCKDSSSVYKYIVNSSGDALCGINTEEKAKVSLNKTCKKR